MDLMQLYENHVTLETVDQRCSVKKVFLKISQNSQENTSARVSFVIKCRPQADGCFCNLHNFCSSALTK